MYFTTVTLGDRFPGLAQLSCDLWGTVVLTGLVIDLPDILLHGILALLSSRWFIFCEGPITGAENA